MSEIEHYCTIANLPSSMQITCNMDHLYLYFIGVVRNFVVYHIPPMTQFEYSTSRPNVQVVVNGKVPTIKSNSLVVDT